MRGSYTGCPANNGAVSVASPIQRTTVRIENILPPYSQKKVENKDEC
jgi:hypothetical protein